MIRHANIHASAVALLAFALSAGLMAPPQARAAPAEPLNVVVILTDDQRWDTLWATNAIRRLAATGATFSNAFISNPVCGPARASFLSGGFRSENTGALSNSVTLGTPFNGNNTLGLPFWKAGYETLFVGKYLNGVSKRQVPPGWSRWNASSGAVNGYFRFDAYEGSSGNGWGTARPTAVRQYATYYQRDAILDFLDDVGSSPFFVFWAPWAPHDSADPAPGDELKFSNYLYRGRATFETDLSDKPAWLTNARNAGWRQPSDDEFRRNQLRSMLAVDRGVKALVDKVAAMGLSDRTLFVFTSDNGYLWGEHGIGGKANPYEESIRVPLAFFGADVPQLTNNSLVLADLDLGPTLVDLAGLGPARSDGLSLRPILQGTKDRLRDSVLIESWGNGAAGSFNTWALLRTSRWKYIKQATGEEELYDLGTDPFEQESLHSRSNFADIRNNLEAQLEARKGLAIGHVWSNRLPPGKTGSRYTVRLQAWGGSGSYKWSVASGSLPDGLSLSASTGVISGVPRVAGTWQAEIRLEDGTTGTHSRTRRQQTRVHTIVIQG